MNAKAITGIALAATALAASGATTQAAGQGLPKGSEPVTLDPSRFSTKIDNPWWPMRQGSRWIYRETDPDGTRQRVVVTVTHRTKLIANGVRARVVRDVVTEGGKPVEKTDDWYAQDRVGNIWYLGEHTVEFENGRPVSTRGSFEAGVDGAQAGVIMPAKPREGMTYRQEYYAGQAEDAGEIFALGQQAEVPFGHFRRVLMTKDTNRLEADVLEFKFFARGVGPVLAIGVSGGADREELVSFRRDALAQSTRRPSLKR